MMPPRPRVVLRDPSSGAPDAPVLRVRALGPLQISGPEGDGGSAWSLAKPRELLLFLLLPPDDSHSTPEREASPSFKDTALLFPPL